MYKTTQISKSLNQNTILRIQSESNVKIIYLKLDTKNLVRNHENHARGLYETPIVIIYLLIKIVVNFIQVHINKTINQNEVL